MATRWSLRRSCTAALAALAVTSCYPKAGPAPQALSADAVASAGVRWPGVTASSLAAGRDLFLARCNGCHAYPDLASVPEADWPHVLDGMARKSHLDAQGRDAVLHFVLASRAEQGGR